MGWSLGYDSNWRRWIGYGVPAYCDHPRCNETIDRGLSYACGGEPFGGDKCGLYFCWKHLNSRSLCPRCAAHRPTPYARPKIEHPDWVRHLLTDESWAEWRKENKEEVSALKDPYPPLDLTVPKFPTAEACSKCGHGKAYHGKKSRFCHHRDKYGIADCSCADYRKPPKTEAIPNLAAKPSPKRNRLSESLQNEDLTP